MRIPEVVVIVVLALGLSTVALVSILRATQTANLSISSSIEQVSTVDTNTVQSVEGLDTRVKNITQLLNGVIPHLNGRMEKLEADVASRQLVIPAPE